MRSSVAPHLLLEVLWAKKCLTAGLRCRSLYILPERQLYFSKRLPELFLDFQKLCGSFAGHRAVLADVHFRYGSGNPAAGIASIILTAALEPNLPSGKRYS